MQALLRVPGPKLLVLATALAAAVVAAVLMYGFRLELFVLPWKLRRILELKQQVSELNEMNSGDRSDQQEVLSFIGRCPKPGRSFFRGCAVPTPSRAIG
ncbi:MAG TPA: hypothetical protein VMT52_14855 [Planctomycetota bacterium]|nr:hypothetical protein [Planctomycetota bacterium]